MLAYKSCCLCICPTVTPNIYPGVEEIGVKRLYAGSDSGCTSPSVADRSLGRCSFRGPKRWKSLGGRSVLSGSGPEPPEWEEYLTGKQSATDGDLQNAVVS
jgi:hypothetical protein